MTLHYKKAMEKVSLSQDAIKNIQTHINEQANPSQMDEQIIQIQMSEQAHLSQVNAQADSSQANARVSSFRRRFTPLRTTGIAAVLCLAMVLLSTGVVSAYEYFFHKIPEEIALTLIPVKLTHTSQDITMTVQYASVKDGTLSIYFTLEDISDLDRLAEGVKFDRSWEVNEPYSARRIIYKYDSLGYDEESNTYGFLVQITPTNVLGDILYFQDQQYTITINQLLLGQKQEEFVYSPDWSTLPDEPEIYKGKCTSWANVENYKRQSYKVGYNVRMLQAGSWEIPVSDGVMITAAGFMNDGFHIQVRYNDQAGGYDFGHLILVTSDENEIGGFGSMDEGNFCYVSYTDADNYQYTDFIYDISPEDLDGASLKGNFICGDTLLDGDWEVTFSVDQSENGDEDSVL